MRRCVTRESSRNATAPSGDRGLSRFPDAQVEVYRGEELRLVVRSDGADDPSDVVVRAWKVPAIPVGTAPSRQPDSPFSECEVRAGRR